MWLIDSLDSRFRRKAIHSTNSWFFCFMSISKPITKLRLLLLPQVDRLKSLRVPGYCIVYSEGSEVSTRTQTENVWLQPYSSRSYKMLFLLAISNCFPPPTLRLPNMDFYLQKNTERLQLSRFAGFYLSCSKFM